MITGEKNRAQKYLTVSTLKLDDVFSEVLGKSSIFICPLTAFKSPINVFVFREVNGKASH